MPLITKSIFQACVSHCLQRKLTHEFENDFSKSKSLLNFVWCTTFLTWTLCFLRSTRWSLNRREHHLLTIIYWKNRERERERERERKKEDPSKINSNYIIYEVKSSKSCSQKLLHLIKLNGHGRTYNETLPPFQEWVLTVYSFSGRYRSWSHPLKCRKAPNSKASLFSLIMISYASSAYIRYTYKNM